MSWVKTFLKGLVANSAAWKLDKADLVNLVRNAAVVAGVSFVGYVLAFVSGHDIGAVSPLVVTALTAALDFLNKLRTDNTK